MDLTNFKVFCALAPPPSQPGSAPDPRAQMFSTILMLAMLGVVFYFLLFRPQQKKAKEHAELLKSIKPGDKIVTSGGIVGVVITVKDKTVSIRSADAKLEITKSAVAEIAERSGEPSES